MPRKKEKPIQNLDRRSFIKHTSLATGALMVGSGAMAYPQDEGLEAFQVDDFVRPDSLQFGDNWESMNPGYWQIQDNSLRRRLKNVGDRARNTGFPYHYETHGEGKNAVMKVNYDPSLPLGIMWNREWKLLGNYTIQFSGSIHALAPRNPKKGDQSDWHMYQPGNGFVGIALGGKTQFESFYAHKNACWMVGFKDDHNFGIFRHTEWDLATTEGSIASSFEALKAGDHFSIHVEVRSRSSKPNLSASLRINDGHAMNLNVQIPDLDTVQGYMGIAARGLLDFSLENIELKASRSQKQEVGINECHSCYALGDSLKQEDGTWTVRFVSLFRNDGEEAAIRISDSEKPEGAWAAVPVAGKGPIISNDFRRNTAIIDVELPFDPSEKTLYYTVWKDGVDVTADPRIGTAGVGSGTGLVGQVPAKGSYVGRLPQLKAPYKLCGLSCHAIHASKGNLPGIGKWQGFHIHDQPTPDAYTHLEDYDFQVMMWEDDIWYMELLLYPPSTDDAYKVVTTSICGPTSRWQMMRHWNVLNPGDHDHGMDDIKGPEQLAIRNRKDLGQDRDYLVRNFQIVSHLMTGKEDPSGTDNPKRWRKWKMPNKDFTLMIIDSRLWRSSQDTNIWDDEGWGHVQNLYARTDPTRSLLGEEQFAWMQEQIRTDSSSIICLTGMNGLHTIWKGTYWGSGMKKFGAFGDRDRVAADYAGWVAAGVDRVLEVLGSRDGVVSVYGDVHNGSIIKNTKHNVYECSFGPIGRSGGREVIDGFGPKMKDFDGRELEAIALYHERYDNILLEKEPGPFYWNFLEMEFDPRKVKGQINFTIRNLIDSPSETYRGGAKVSADIVNTGRAISCKLPVIRTLAHADIVFLSLDGTPIRGARSDAEGRISVPGLVDISPGETVVILAISDEETDSQIIRTLL